MTNPLKPIYSNQRKYRFGRLKNKIDLANKKMIKGAEPDYEDIILKVPPRMYRRLELLAHGRKTTMSLMIMDAVFKEIQGNQFEYYGFEIPKQFKHNFENKEAAQFIYGYIVPFYTAGIYVEELFYSMTEYGVKRKQVWLEGYARLLESNSIEEFIQRDSSNLQFKIKKVRAR